MISWVMANQMVMGIWNRDEYDDEKSVYVLCYLISYRNTLHNKLNTCLQ